MWINCEEAGLDDVPYESLVRADDIEDGEDNSPFAEESNFSENQLVAIFFEIRDNRPPHLEVKFKRKLNIYYI